MQYNINLTICIKAHYLEYRPLADLFPLQHPARLGLEPRTSHTDVSTLPFELSSLDKQCCNHSLFLTIHHIISANHNNLPSILHIQLSGRSDTIYWTEEHFHA